MFPYVNYTCITNKKDSNIRYAFNNVILSNVFFHKTYKCDYQTLIHCYLDIKLQKMKNIYIVLILQV